MTIGYSRISTPDQDLALQNDALTAAGCERIFSDVASGAKAQRKGLEDCLAHLRKGDLLVVWKLDRLGRSALDLVRLVESLAVMGVHFKTLTEGFDTTTPGGKMVFTIFAAVAEMERSLIRERTKAGLEAARARGRQGGRPPGLSKKAEMKSHTAASLYSEKKLSAAQICEQLDISSPTLYRYLRARGVKIGK